MQKSIKKEKIIEYVRHAVDIYLSRNIDKIGFVHILDVNMSDDFKTAFVYLSCPLHQNEKSLERSIIKDRTQISEIMKEIFSSKYTPRTEIICVKEFNDKF